MRRPNLPDRISNPPGRRPLRRLRLALGLTQKKAAGLVKSERTGRELGIRRWRQVERMADPPLKYFEALNSSILSSLGARDGS